MLPDSAAAGRADAGAPSGPDRVDGAARAGLARHPTEVAPHLLGATLASNLGPGVVLRITEVEAYGDVGEDPGSHAFRGQTPRNAMMFAEPGHAYVYFTYGMHWCLNVVAHAPGSSGAVLLRAGAVLSGLPTARDRRPAARTDRDLARGPARLAACLGVTGALDGADLLDPGSPLRLKLTARSDTAGTAGTAEPVGGYLTGPRTGVSGAGAPMTWRFWLPEDPTVSPYRPSRPR